MADMDYPVNRSDANLDIAEERRQEQWEKQHEKEPNAAAHPFETRSRAAMDRDEAKFKLELEKKWVAAEKERIRNAKALAPENRDTMDGVDVVDANESELPL